MSVEIDISRFDATTKGGPSTGGVVGRSGLCRIAFGEGNQQRRKRSTILHYFTLIELLVVVAVLAILMSLMYPSLRRALREAQEVVCMNNIHQLSLAAINYSGDYIDNYPPPIKWLDRNSGQMSRAHPHDLKLSDVNHIAYYLGLDPNRFQDSSTPIIEAQIPSSMKCPFHKWAYGGMGYMNLYEKSSGYFVSGYGYFGRLEWTPVGWASHTGVPDIFKRKYADRFCDPDAALWGDSISNYTMWGSYKGFSHTYSGSPKDFWTENQLFQENDRQNMGRVDGSVVIRWASEINANSNSLGNGLSGWGGGYAWWYAPVPD